MPFISRKKVKAATKGTKWSDLVTTDSKTPEPKTKALDFAAKSNEIAENYQKIMESAPKSLKGSIGSERERYSRMYGVSESAPPIPNPNEAFRRRKSRNRFFGTKTAAKNNFVVPDRHKELFDDMIARGNSVQYTIVCIKQKVADQAGQKDVAVSKGEIKSRPWDYKKNDWTKPQAVEEVVDPLAEDDSLWDIDDEDMDYAPPGTKYKVHTKKKQAASNKLDKAYGIYGNEGEENTPEEETGTKYATPIDPTKKWDED